MLQNCGLLPIGSRKANSMTHWIDFSGAPPLLIPKRLAKYWRGPLLSGTNIYSEMNQKVPITDYDRACKAAWPGRGVLPLHDSSALALYTEFDQHLWDDDRKLVACGGWLPSDEELSVAVWSDPFDWSITDSEFLLMNSAENGEDGLPQGSFIDLRLSPGRYVVEYADLEAQYVGIFHRFTCVNEVPCRG